MRQEPEIYLWKSFCSALRTIKLVDISARHHRGMMNPRTALAVAQKVNGPGSNLQQREGARRSAMTMSFWAFL